MASDTAMVPRSATDMTVYAVGENTAGTESDVAFNQVEVAAKKWMGLTRISSELIEDAVINLGDWVTNNIAHGFAKKEDECGFIGDGTSTYHGIEGIVTKISGLAGAYFEVGASDLAWADLVLGDFESVVGMLPEYAHANAKWHITRPGFAASMQRLMDAAGGNTVGDIASGTPLQFLGYPVVLNSVMTSSLADTASTVKCLLGDMSLAAALGDRRGFTVKVSEDRYFEYDQVGIKATSRWGINVHDVGTASVAGPVVGLKTPAS